MNQKKYVMNGKEDLSIYRDNMRIYNNRKLNSKMIKGILGIYKI